MNLNIIRVVLVVWGCGGFAQAKELTLAEALEKANVHYPTLASARTRETAAESAITIAKSGYLPTLDAAAIYSTGFPGSSGALGVTGLMGSPYRSGLAGGVVLRQNLWDFGRTSSGVDAAKQAVQVRREETKLARYELYRDVAILFYECSRFRSQLAVWTEVESAAKSVEKEIQKFVRTGQRSKVDHYLASAQAEEAAQAIAGYDARLRATVGRLALMTGIPESDIACPFLPERNQAIVVAKVDIKDNPWVRRAEKDLELSRAQLSQAKAGHLPRLVGIASVGDMERARLVNEQNYAIGAGLIIPIFDGWKTTGEVERASATQREKESEIEVAKQRVAEWDSKYGELIESSRARLEHLEHELELAEEGFRLAKERYFSFRGVLVDLREALRNLSRVQSQTNDTWADILQAASSRSFINGAEK